MENNKLEELKLKHLWFMLALMLLLLTISCTAIIIASNHMEGAVGILSAIMMLFNIFLAMIWSFMIFESSMNICIKLFGRSK